MATPPDHHRARRHHIACAVLADRGLVHRHGLPGQRRLVHEQRRRVHDVRVGGHDVTLGQHQQVPDNHLGRGDQPLLAISQHPCLGRREFRQGRDGLTRLHLLGDSHSGIRDDHQQDDRGIGPVTRRDSQHRRGQQHEAQRVAQLTASQSPRRGPAGPRQLVRAKPGQPLRGIGGGQARK